MSIDTSLSYYINPNTRSLTSNIKNTAVKDREAINFMFDEMSPVEDLMTALKTPINLAESTRISRTSNSVSLAAGTQIRINDGYVLTVKPQGVEVSHTEGYDPYDQKAYLKAQQMASSLDALLRNAGGTRDRIANTGEKQQWVTQGITDVLSYLGIDTNKDFYVNGMKYSTNSKGCFESEAAAEAQAAYERQKAANRTYEFADGDAHAAGRHGAFGGREGHHRARADVQHAGDALGAGRRHECHAGRRRFGDVPHPLGGRLSGDGSGVRRRSRRHVQRAQDLDRPFGLDGPHRLHLHARSAVAENL